MIDLGAIAKAFPELSSLTTLSTDTGQRNVLAAERGAEKIVLKLLRPGQDPARTQREIDAVTRVKSDRVPAIYEVGKRDISGTEVFYTIEQRITGQTLASVLKKTPKPDLAFVVNAGDALLEACAAAEAERVVHRDIKPGNLMIDDTGKLWVIDFGIARVLDLPSLTGTASAFGVFSFGYGAPEQIRNVKTEINSRADLFSIGVVMHEMLTGTNLYLNGAKDAMEVIRRMLSLDLPAPSHAKNLNGELGLFVSNMASRYPSRRPQNTKEARDWYADIRKQLGV